MFFFLAEIPEKEKKCQQGKENGRRMPFKREDSKRTFWGKGWGGLTAFLHNVGEGGGNPSGKGGADDKFIPVTRACHSRKKPAHRREAEQQKPLVDLQETLLRGPFSQVQQKQICEGEVLVWFIQRFMSSLIAVFSQTAGSKKGLFSILVSRVLA